MVGVDHTYWSITLFGGFQPMIFQPSWLEHHSVISKEAAAAPTYGPASPGAVNMTLGGMNVQVSPDQFQVSTLAAPAELILDFVSKIFSEILPHSNIHGFFIGKSANFRTTSPGKKTEMMRRIAPTDLWDDLSGGYQGSNVHYQDLPVETASVWTRKFFSNNLSSGVYNSTYAEIGVGHSEYLNPSTAVFILVNRYFWLQGEQSTIGARRAIFGIRNEYSSALQSADKIIDYFRAMAV